MNRHGASSCTKVGRRDRKGLWWRCEKRIISIQFNMNERLLKI